MKRNILMFLSIMFTYIVVDIAYQVAFAIKLVAALYEKAGISDVMTSAPNYPATILLFFVMIAFVLQVVVVKPAIEKKSVKQAIYHGMLVGIAAYSTLGFVFLWGILNWPAVLFFEFTLEGILFPSISSGFTAWLFLRKER